MLQLPQLGANCTPTTYRLDFRDSQARCAGRDRPIHVRQEKNSMRVISLAAARGEEFLLAVKKRLLGVPGIMSRSGASSRSTPRFSTRLRRKNRASDYSFPR